MRLVLDPTSIADYKTFLRVKQLPVYKIRGHEAWFPDEYAGRLGLDSELTSGSVYTPQPGLFDYQAFVSGIAIRKRKFAAFVRPGLGKTFILGEFARHALDNMRAKQRCLLVSPLNIIWQTISELDRFYGGSLTPEYIPAIHLQAWIDGAYKPHVRFAITNFEAIKKGLSRGTLGALLIDESGMMKSAYGQWAGRLIQLGKGIKRKLCATGCAAPNDRIEYANHAVFLDQCPNVNSFLSKYFINRGQTANRWELKPHALRPFYRDLSHWSIFLSNPAKYGFKDNCNTLPPIHTHLHEVELTAEQKDAAYSVLGKRTFCDPGGITKRNTLSRIAKGTYQKRRIATNKYDYIQQLASGWPEESTLGWAWFDDEQERLAAVFPDGAHISGKTKLTKRLELIEDFKQRRKPSLWSKPKILGFGLNLQVATRMVFSSLIDSYEAYMQCVARANRVGSTRDLNVHLPMTEIEEPMVDTVLKKRDRVEADIAEQEALFKESANVSW